MLPRLAVAGALLAAVVAAPVAAAASSGVAALQVALRSHGLYAGSVDGVGGPATVEATRAFQRRTGLPPDGVAGPRTRAALGPLGRPALGARVLVRGLAGWDVAELQFLLATRGFPSATFDGVLGERTEAALRRFQRSVGLPPDGRAGAATLAAVRAPPPPLPVALARPVAGELGDRFGPRGARFHTGVDFRAPAGTPVVAAAAGTVTYAGWFVGYGLLVTLAHGGGARTLYAHLARIDVRLGQRLARGAALGLVGSTGTSTGPHLHFEGRVRGAAIDPLPAFG